MHARIYRDEIIGSCNKTMLSYGTEISEGARSVTCIAHMSWWQIWHAQNITSSHYVYNYEELTCTARWLHGPLPWHGNRVIRVLLYLSASSHTWKQEKWVTILNLTKKQETSLLFHLPLIFLYIMKVVATNNDGSVHLGTVACACQDATPNWHITGEWAFLINIGSCKQIKIVKGQHIPYWSFI